MRRAGPSLFRGVLPPDATPLAGFLLKKLRFCCNAGFSSTRLSFTGHLFNPLYPYFFPHLP
jgi:hypothetical protein